MCKVLILTNSSDPHADAVIRSFKDQDAVFRLNTENLLTDFEYDFEISKAYSLANFINPIGNAIKVNDISCVYYRRPEKPKMLSQQATEKVVVDEAWHGLYHLLFDLFDKPWLGHPHRDKFASSRVLQLNMAKKLGWNVPPTIITKNANKIRKFLSHHEQIAIKPLGEKGIIENNNWIPYFTSKVSSKELIEKSDSELGLTYNYLQAYIPKKNEWRITVVGEEVFPCVIHSQESEGGQTDWRTISFDSILHEKAEIPEHFQKELVMFLKQMQLPFGAFDFILTPDNKFVFLECNPNGQWLWIEELTGMPIAKSIANWLEKRNNDFIP